MWVVSDLEPFVRFPFKGLGNESVSPMHHMAIRDDVTVGSEHESAAGSTTATRTFARWTEYVNANNAGADRRGNAGNGS